VNVVQKQKYLREENKKWPDVLIPVPPEQWPIADIRETRIELWRSCDYLVQVFQEPDGILRMSVSVTMIGHDGEWVQNIPWEDLHELKAEIGRGDLYAIEIYPPDRDLVNVANMRHLWILPEPLPIGWRTR